MTTVASGSAAPVVTLQPANQTVKTGTRATFTAGASGTPSPTVRWQVSTDNGVTFANIPGATAPTLIFVVSSTQTGDKYRAVFTNGSGTATTTAAILTVSMPPIVTQNPANETVTDGATVTFVAAAMGSPIPTVQWQLSTNSGVSFTNLVGATSKTITFRARVIQNGNRYRAVFTNTAGTASTTAAALTVNANQPTTIAGNITAKAGPPNARVWTLSILNNGPGSAIGVKITTFTLTQTAGAACTPMVNTSFPLTVSNLGPAQTRAVSITVNFTGCTAAARFTATFTYSANSGAVTGSVVRTNQFQ